MGKPKSLHFSREDAYAKIRGSQKEESKLDKPKKKSKKEEVVLFENQCVCPFCECEDHSICECDNCECDDCACRES